MVMILCLMLGSSSPATEDDKIFEMVDKIVMIMEKIDALQENLTDVATLDQALVEIQILKQQLREILIQMDAAIMHTTGSDYAYWKGIREQRKQSW